jgi:hypothetical protein
MMIYIESYWKIKSSRRSFHKNINLLLMYKVFYLALHQPLSRQLGVVVEVTVQDNGSPVGVATMFTLSVAAVEIKWGQINFKFRYS